MFVRSIARRTSYCIRSLWINAHTYNLSFQSFLGGRWRGGGSEFLRGKEVHRFEVVHELPCINREEGGWADIKNGG